MTEPLIDPNLIREIGTEEGLKDPIASEGFVPGYTPLDLKDEELHASKDDYEDIKDIVSFEIGEKDKLKPSESKLIADIEQFLLRTARKFQIDMGKLMDYYKMNRGNGVFTEEIIEKMKSKRYDLPTFSIKGSKEAELFLKENGIVDYRLNPDFSYTVVFNLPKPLARFWYRGGTDSWDEGGIDIPEDNIEWGFLYRNIMPGIWESIGEEVAEGVLSVRRLNQIRQHDPKNYYYIREIDHAPNQTQME